MTFCATLSLHSFCDSISLRFIFDYFKCGGDPHRKYVGHLGHPKRGNVVFALQFVENTWDNITRTAHHKPCLFHLWRVDGRHTIIAIHQVIRKQASLPVLFDMSWLIKCMLQSTIYTRFNSTFLLISDAPALQSHAAITMRIIINKYCLHAGNTCGQSWLVWVVKCACVWWQRLLWLCTYMLLIELCQTGKIVFVAFEKCVLFYKRYEQ